MTKSGPSLPSNRAFVVQFRVQQEDSQQLCTGRVEHLVTGQATHFESWKDLQEFIEQTLVNSPKLPYG